VAISKGDGRGDGAAKFYLYRARAAKSVAGDDAAQVCTLFKRPKRKPEIRGFF
jgi:hypothetical protein